MCIYIYIYISSNKLIRYVYEFGPGRGKFRKSPVISSYANAFCELSIAIVVSLSSKSALCSVSLSVISCYQLHSDHRVPTKDPSCTRKT